MKIAHISDIHCNYGNDFNERVFDQAVKLLNSIEADLIFISGDLTTEGLLNEYKLAKEKISKINGNIAIVSGNHDERNLGFKLFPEFFGEQNFTQIYDDINLIGLSSSEPDRDDGRLGRERHTLIEKGITNKNNFNIIGFHHHLIPVPNSGRENNIIEDAGETLDIILKNDIPLVLMGHRHVPFGVKIHNTLLVNAGTFSSNRTRAHIGNTFNIIEIENNNIIVSVVDIFKQKIEIKIEFDIEKGDYSNKFYN
jgi:3',5'-cyclic AMP phosphodiesterase CpdA